MSRAAACGDKRAAASASSMQVVSIALISTSLHDDQGGDHTAPSLTGTPHL